MAANTTPAKDPSLFVSRCVISRVGRPATRRRMARLIRGPSHLGVRLMEFEVLAVGVVYRWHGLERREQPVSFVSRTPISRICGTFFAYCASRSLTSADAFADLSEC